ncbi:MAG: DUF2231 domain-containing protein [Thermomicrobiales bacterium]
MKTPARILGHPIHALSVTVPLGALVLSVVLDVINLIDEREIWKDSAYVLIGLGVLAGLAVAVPGLVDWLSIPASHPAKRVGLLHAASNIIGLILFAISWYLRYDQPDNWSTAAFILSLLGIGALSAGGWLGGELVYRHGIGVDVKANPSTR